MELGLADPARLRVLDERAPDAARRRLPMPFGEGHESRYTSRRTPTRQTALTSCPVALSYDRCHPQLVTSGGTATVRPDGHSLQVNRFPDHALSAPVRQAEPSLQAENGRPLTYSAPGRQPTPPIQSSHRRPYQAVPALCRPLHDSR